MKLIIDIPKGTYDVIQNGYTNQVVEYTLLKSVQNGTPLDDVKAEIDQYLFQNEFGSEYRKEVSQIIDKHIGKAESEDKE